MAITSVNPATAQEVARFDEHSLEHIDLVLQRAYDAQRDWRRLSFESRGAHLAQVARLIREDKPRLAALATEEMGKPLVEAAAEVEKCAWSIDWYAENSAELLAPKEMPSSATQSYVQYQPLGVVLAVMPWNFPYWQFFRAAAPALMAGNTIILKHASNVPRCSLAIEELFVRAGVPTGVASSLLVGSSAVAGLIADRRIAAVTLTGSDVAGAKVAEAAGKVLKKCVLELGGSDPFIVLDDADLEYAVDAAVFSRFTHQGQICMSANRVLVHESIFDDFVDRYVAKVRTLKVGNPRDDDTIIGPLITAKQAENLNAMVDRAITDGARAAIRGEVNGGVFDPVVLLDVDPDMEIAQKELFGPVVSVIPFKSDDEAVEIANNSDFGLSGAVHTGDIDRGVALARRVETGMIHVNDCTIHDEPIVAFGGEKQSGLGRLNGPWSLDEFTTMRWVSVNRGRRQFPY